ncbi:MAG: DUF262 domain-containing protein [Alphaproteobacteria bacterium]
MKTWSIKRTTFSVADFRGWAKDSSLHLSPSFQRRPVWKKQAKSYFIDTIIRDLPVPIIFLREKTDIQSMRTIREVVDGQQRLRSILSFIDPNSVPDYKPEQDSFFILKTHNEKLANISFKNLPEDIQHKILSYQFSVHVLPSDTSDKDVLEIFARMNSTGTTLNAQELRNAEFLGYFKKATFEASLNQLENWRKWKIFTEQSIARMEEVELTSELFILIIAGIKGKNKETIDDFYKKYEESFPKQKIVEERFQTTIDAIDDLFGKKLKDTNFSKRTLFYPLFAFFYDQLFGMNSSLEKKKPRSLSPSIRQKLLYANLMLSEKTAKAHILDAASRRTTHIGNRKTLFKFLSEENKQR